MNYITSIEIAQKFNNEFRRIVALEEHSEETTDGAMLAFAISLVEYALDEFKGDKERALAGISNAINIAIQENENKWM